jgi:hypothetical protein
LSSRAAWATLQDPVSIKQNNSNNKNMWQTGASSSYL